MQTCTQQTHTHSNTHTQRGTNQIVKKCNMLWEDKGEHYLKASRLISGAD